MSIFKQQLDSESEQVLSLILIRNVMNMKEVKNKVMDGSLDCCVMKPSLIIHPFQVVVAANKAVSSQKQGRLTTKTMFTELLYNLSTSRNISQSLVKFGADETEKNVLVGVFEKHDSNIDLLEENVLRHFQGEQYPIEKLNEFSNVDLIKKTYNIKELESQVSSLIDSIVSRIASKDCALF